MTLKRKSFLFVLIAGVFALLLSACGGQTGSAAKDPRNNTIYDHSELAWYIQQRYGVEQDDCQYYSIEFAQKSGLVARFSDDSNATRYIVRVFGPTIADGYRNESWVLESVSTATIEDEYNGKSIEQAEFVYGSSIIHMFIANNSSGQIERMFIISDSGDYHKGEGEFFIWKYDGSRNATGMFHASGRFSEAFYGQDARGELTKVYGDYYTFTYDADGRLQTSEFSSAQLKDNVVGELKGGSETTRTLDFSYDDEGNRTAATGQDRGNTEKLEFSRDSDGRVVEVVITMSQEGDDGAETYKAKVTLTYNDDGSVVYSDPALL